MPPERTIGAVLKEKRVDLGWSLELASKKTAIPLSVLQAIEEMTLNRFINQGAKLDLHLSVYANRLGVPLKSHQTLVQKARQSIRPHELTPDQLDFIRNSP